MTEQGLRVCTSCGAALAPGARFCRSCGTPIELQPPEFALSGGRRLHLDADRLSLRELLAVVESGVMYWRQHLESSEGVAREQAAAAIKELSQILDSLATQIAQGRETVQITGRLAAQRAAPLVCPHCGRGNRAKARYCVACGAVIGTITQPTRPLPPPTLNLTIAGRTDVGMARPLNEDTIYAGELSTSDGPLATLLMVADGMGGHQAGEVASALACETVKQVLPAALSTSIPTDDAGWHALLRHTVAEANRRVYQHAQANPAQRGMGTTLTLAVLSERRAHLAHVGDCRAYLLNQAGVTDQDGRWLQLTTDHSLVARLVDIGQLTPAQARVHPQRNVVYRSLGSDPHVEVDTLSQALAPGDQLLICSDGLVNHVEDDELAGLVLATTAADRACEQLIDLANQRGGKDNISVVIARVQK
ncbi:MAG: Stp1/IreP family PP2C-type Ser/Thr phosphatase [Oscillochloridaceae bacterium umkhey_bin13]